MSDPPSTPDALLDKLDPVDGYRTPGLRPYLSLEVNMVLTNLILYHTPSVLRTMKSCHLSTGTQLRRYLSFVISSDSLKVMSR